MTIQSEPEGEIDDAGRVYHNYSRPYSHEQMPNQGVWPDTEVISDASKAGNATIRLIAHDPAGDEASRQIMRCVEYENAPARRYVSRYEIDLWTSPHKKFVYPHRVDHERGALEGTDYLAEDAQRYNLQGRFDKPELWKLARHRIRLKNICFIDDVTVTDPGARTRITWQLDGAWDRISNARVSVCLQQRSEPERPWRDIARLARGVPCNAGSITADLSGHPGRQLRIMIRRDGDPQTGGMSAPFALQETP